MNWKQLFTSATPAERLEMVISMLRRIEARRGYAIPHAPRYHMVEGDQRDSRPVFRYTFLFILVTWSFGTWIALLRLPPVYGAPLLFFHLVGLVVILVIKPYRHRSRSLTINNSLS